MRLFNYKMLFIFFIALKSILPAQIYGQAVKDYLQPAYPVQMTGYIANRMNLCYDKRILAQDADYLIAPFRNRTETRLWQSEFWGKWFTSAVLAYKYRPEQQLKLKLQEAINKLLETQTPDGYIGNYAPGSHLQGWDIWGRKYTLLGLLDYYELTKEKKYLNAASRLADHLMRELKESNDGLIVTKGFFRGMAASSVLEPIVKLYRMSGNAKYLAFAKEIVRQWETPKGPQLISKSMVNVSERFPKSEKWFSAEQGHKAYEMMSCYEGLLELYRVTGEPAYLEAVKNTWKNIRDQEINIAGSGALEEMWFGGRRKQTMPIARYQETCVTATWIKLSQQLLRLTGEAEYADEIERSYYNALLAGLNNDASEWAQYTPLNGQRHLGSGQCGMDINCCNASGPRGLYTLPLTSVMTSGDGLSVNFFVPGHYTVVTPSGQKAVLIVETNYPLSGEIKIRLEIPHPENLNIRIRIPQWSLQNMLTINGGLISNIHAGTFTDIKRNWASGNVIVLKLDMRGRVVQQKDGASSFLSICRGPIVLSAGSRFSAPPLVSVYKPVYDSLKYIQLTPVKKTTADNVWMQFEGRFIPEPYTGGTPDPIKITLCDYASAGNGKYPSSFITWFEQLYQER